MSDVTVTIGAKGTGEAVSAMRKVGAEAEKIEARVSRAGSMGGGGGRQKNFGMAALAASQAFEDAQYGLRGILNNIPQMALFVGAAPEVAAGISILAVAASIAGPKLFDLSKDMEKLEQSTSRADTIAASLKAVRDVLFDFDTKQSFKNQSKAIDEQMDFISKTLTGPQKAFDEFSKKQSEREDAIGRISRLRDQLEDMNAPAGESGMRSALREKLATEQEIARAKERQLAAQNAIADLEFSANDAQSANPRNDSGFMSDDDYRGILAQKKTEVEGIKNAQLGLDERAKKVRDMMISGTDPKSILARSIAGIKGGDFQKRAVAASTAADKAAAANKSALDTAEKEMRLLEQKKDLQDTALSKYDATVSKSDEERKSLEDQLSAIRGIIDARKAELSVKQDLLKAEANKQADEKIGKLNEYAMNNQVRGENFLSSLGRVGLGGKEARNALGVINMQRQANKYLSEIAKNTRSQAARYSGN